MHINSPAGSSVFSALPGSPAGSTPSSPTPAPLPSVHVRAVITWLAIFPLVAMGMVVLNPLMENWHPILRALLLTAVVVPAAVYFVVPKLFAAYGTLMKHRAQRAAAAKP